LQRRILIDPNPRAAYPAAGVVVHATSGF
jgi:hypothetical protein